MSDDFWCPNEQLGAMCDYPDCRCDIDDRRIGDEEEIAELPEMFEAATLDDVWNHHW